MLMRLWNDEAGFIVSSELILIATLVVIGMIGGLSTVRDQVVGELNDVAGALGDVNQSYSFSGVSAHSGSTSGSVFSDLADFCEGANGANNQTATAFALCTTTVVSAGE